MTRIRVLHPHRLWHIPQTPPPTPPQTPPPTPPPTPPQTPPRPGWSVGPEWVQRYMQRPLITQSQGYRHASMATRTHDMVWYLRNLGTPSPLLHPLRVLCTSQTVVARSSASYHQESSSCHVMSCYEASSALWTCLRRYAVPSAPHRWFKSLV